MRPPIAVLDADVLVPVLTCDLLLHLFDAGLFVPVVSPTILGAVQRNLIADFPHLDPEALRRRATQMAAALSNHTHDQATMEPSLLAGVNRKDRHIVAIAIAQGADVVVSNDRRLRREVNTLERPLAAVTADDFALRLHCGHSAAVSDVVDVLTAKRTRRPVTRDEMIQQLARRCPASRHGCAAESSDRDQESSPSAGPASRLGALIGV
jgi:PIN domain